LRHVDSACPPLNVQISKSYARKLKVVTFSQRYNQLQ